MWDDYAPVLQRAARSAAPMVARFGWTADDCEQMAYLWWVERGVDLAARLERTENREAYLGISLRRHLYRAAKACALDAVQPCEDTALDVAERRNTGAWLEVVDLVESAPTPLRPWLRARVFDGMTQEEAAASLGMSRRTAERFQRAAEKWFLEQWGLEA